MKNKNLLFIPVSVAGLFLLTRNNNLNNPYILRPAYHNLDTYFPTPSIVILEPSFSRESMGELHYFCANHTYPFKNNDSDDYGGYSYREQYEQPCEECLTDYVDYHNYTYLNNQWIFKNNDIPVNWKNPLTKIKDFDKLMQPTSHGFTIDDISIKQIYKQSPLMYSIAPLKDSGYPKNQNTIAYLKQWYYKVPDFDTTQLNEPFWGIHYKIKQ